MPVSDVTASDTVSPVADYVDINAGAGFTNTVNVTIELSATDDTGIVAYYLSDSDISPTANSSGWININATTNLQQVVAFTFTAETSLGSFNKDVYAWFKDAAGNVSASVMDTIVYTAEDTVMPNVVSIAINNDDASTNTTNVTLHISANDDHNIVAYYASESTAYPSADDLAWVSIEPTASYTATVPFTLTGAPGPGSYERDVRIWVMDESGNISNDMMDRIALVITDATPPTGTALLINGGAAATTNTLVTLAISALDNIAVTAYLATESYAPPSNTDTGWVTVVPASSFNATVAFTLSAAPSVLPGNYPKVVSVWFRDSSGNMSLPVVSEIDLMVEDTAPPFNPSLSINGGAITTDSTAVMLDLSASDNAGITAYIISESPVTPLSSDSWQVVAETLNYNATISHTLTGAGSTYAGSYSKTVYVWFKDAAGHISVAADASIDLIVTDTIIPWNPAIEINAGAMTVLSTDVTLNLSASDDAGVTAYFASESSVTPVATDAAWVAVTPAQNYNATVSFTLAGSGTPGVYPRSVYVWYKDAAGHVSAAVNDSINYEVVDVTAPLVSSVSIDAAAVSTTITAVSLSISATDDVGVTGYYASESLTTPFATDSGWVSVTPSTDLNITVAFTLTATAVTGTHLKNIYVWYKDAAGNVSTQVSDSIDFIVADIIPPSTGSVSINSGAITTASATVSVQTWGSDDFDLAEYYMSESAVTPLATDTGWVAVTATTSSYSVVPMTLSSSVTPGIYTKTVYVWYKDAAGNITVTPASDSIDLEVLDLTAPALPTILINGGAASTTSTAATVDLSAEDNVGVSAYYLSESAVTPSYNQSGWVDVAASQNLNRVGVVFTLSGDALPGTFTRTVYAWFKDAAGNVSAAASAAIELTLTDTSAPTLATLSINGGAATTDQRDVTLSLSASDDFSIYGYYLSESAITPLATDPGWVVVTAEYVINTTGSWILSSPASLASVTRTLYVWYKDSSGNVSQPASASIELMLSASAVPDTGQVICVDNVNQVHSIIDCPLPGNALAQDGSYNVDNQKSYTDNGDGTVTDNVTGLIWQQSARSGTLDLANALTYCSANDAGLPGGAGWRLPTDRELMQLGNNELITSPLIDAVFTGTEGPYWSSVILDSFYGKLVDKGLTTNKREFKSWYYGNVRCVKGEEIKAPAWLDNGDQTVTDVQTGLMWDQRESIAMNWKTALNYCESLTHASYTDWRMPNKNELYSLVNSVQGVSVKIDTGVFTGYDINASDYWSSTTAISTTSLFPSAWRLGFGLAITAPADKTYSFNVRCVR